MPGAGGRRQWAVTTKGYGVSFWDDRNVLELDGGDGAQHSEYTKNHWEYALKWWILYYVNYISVQK